MDWLANITVDTTVALGVVVFAAFLTVRARKPAAHVGRVIQTKVKTVKPLVVGLCRSKLSWTERFFASIAKRLPTIVTFFPQIKSRVAPSVSQRTVTSNSVERMGRSVQWDRVTGVVSCAIERAGSVQRWQQAAEDQLDAATYAINGLLDELMPVMPQAFNEMHHLEPIPVMVSRPQPKLTHRTSNKEKRPTAAMLALAANQAVAA